MEKDDKEVMAWAKAVTEKMDEIKLLSPMMFCLGMVVGIDTEGAHTALCVHPHVVTPEIELMAKFMGSLCKEGFSKEVDRVEKELSEGSLFSGSFQKKAGQS